MQKISDDKKVQFQNETTVTMDFIKSAKSLNEILSSKIADIFIIKPGYKYQKQEMYYINEILVEP